MPINCHLQCRVMLFLSLAFIPAALSAASLEVYTDVWPPYINAEDESSGRAAKLLELVAAEREAVLEWEYLPYDLAFELIRRGAEKGEARSGFPYFWTPARGDTVLYSDPVFTVTTRIFFNRQFMRSEPLDDDLKEFRIGRVAGYSYGQSLDSYLRDAEIFPTEVEALNALFANDIDLLPMTEGVMAATLKQHYPERTELIRDLRNFEDNSSLHVIASRNQAGEKLLASINESLAMLKKNRVAGFSGNKTVKPESADIARLILVEGYPAILGQTSANREDAMFYSLPLGTTVLVTQWSQRMLESSHSDRFYKTMVDLSRVVVLNGPHTGKELYVRNMHLELL